MPGLLGSEVLVGLLLPINNPRELDLSLSSVIPVCINYMAYVGKWI